MAIYNGTVGNDHILGSDENDEIYGLAGADNLKGGIGNDIISGGTGNDYLKGEDGIDNISGGLGNDNLSGGAGDDVLNGDGGIDWFIGDSGADNIDGGTEIDTVTYINSTSGVTAYLDGTAGVGGDAQGDTITNVEQLIGSNYDDELRGNSSANLIMGGLGNDTVYGNGGNDIIYGGTGSDTIDGGTEIDTVSYTDSTAGVTAYLDGTAGVGGTAQGDVISNTENIQGSYYGDTLYGDSGVNRIDGLDGDDTIEGGDGADRIIGGSGTDTLAYTTSDSGVTVYLNYSGGLGLGYAVGNQDGGDGGHGAGDIISEIENLTGSSHNDYLAGDDNVNTILGGDGNDWIRGGAGADTLDGGNGTADALLYDNSNAGVTAYISGSGSTGGHAEGDVNSNFEIMYGSIYDDTLYGSANGESIMGNAGNDIIEGYSGADNLYGGNGVDTLVYSSSDTAITISLVDGSIGVGGHAEGDNIREFENIIGSNYDDILHGNSVANIINGGDGVDTVDYSDAVAGDSGTYGIYINLDGFSAGNSSSLYSVDSAGDIIMNVENVIGSDYTDIILENSFDNSIYAGGGNDYIHCFIGADYIDGGTGTDTVYYNYSSSGITVYLDGTMSSGGHAEGDILISIENIGGTNYDDVIICNDLNNSISGGNGADNINGKGGFDTVYYNTSNAAVTVYLDGTVCTGGEAEGDVVTNVENIFTSSYDDIIVGNDSANHIWAGEGADNIDGGLGNDQIYYNKSTAAVTVYLEGTVCTGGEAEGDVLSSVEQVLGSNYDDTIYGNDVNNFIDGSQGNDIIYGKGGRDNLTGNIGNDIFVYNLEAESTSTVYDTITDFTQGEDVLRFEDSVFGADWTAFSVDTSTGDTIITHTTLTDFEIHLTGAYTLTETDFSFV